MDLVDQQAVEVLREVRDQVQAGRWVQGVWTYENRRCLQGLIAAALQTRSVMPTPVDVRVFWAVWKALPEWCNKSIPRFNDAFGTTRVEIILVIDKAIDSLTN